MEASAPDKLLVRLAHFPQMGLALQYYTSPSSNDDYYIAKLCSPPGLGCELTLLEMFVNKRDGAPKLFVDSEIPLLSLMKTDFFIDAQDVPKLHVWLEKCRDYGQRHQVEGLTPTLKGKNHAYRR